MHGAPKSRGYYVASRPAPSCSAGCSGRAGAELSACLCWPRVDFPWPPLPPLLLPPPRPAWRMRDGSLMVGEGRGSARLVRALFVAAFHSLSAPIQVCRQIKLANHLISDHGHECCRSSVRSRSRAEQARTPLSINKLTDLYGPPPIRSASHDSKCPHPALPGDQTRPDQTRQCARHPPPLGGPAAREPPLASFIAFRN